MLGLLWELSCTAPVRTLSSSHSPMSWLGCSRLSVADGRFQGSSGGERMWAGPYTAPEWFRMGHFLMPCAITSHCIMSQDILGGFHVCIGGHRICSCSCPGHMVSLHCDSNTHRTLCSGSSFCPIQREVQCPSGSCCLLEEKEFLLTSQHLWWYG